MIYPCSYCGGEIRPRDNVESNGDPNARSHGNCARCNAALMDAMDRGLDLEPADVQELARLRGPACQRGVW